MKHPKLAFQPNEYATTAEYAWIIGQMKWFTESSITFSICVCAMVMNAFRAILMFPEDMTFTLLDMQKGNFRVFH